MQSRPDRKQILLYVLIGIALSALCVWLIVWVSGITHTKQQLQQDVKATAKEKFDASLEVSKTIVSGVGTIATIVGSIVLYWNFLVAKENAALAQKKLEQEAERFTQESKLAESRLTTERFFKAFEQLSDFDNIEARLGGIYLLERIAQDSRQDHWAIMEVLTSIVREKSAAKYKEKKESRYSIEIQAILTVLGRRNISYDLEGQYLNLRKAHLPGLTLTGNFTNVDLRGATLSEANFVNATLENVNFIGADLTKAGFSNVNLTNVDLRDACLELTSFEKVKLANSYLDGANLNRARMQEANLRKVKLSGAFLYAADLTAADLEEVDFRFAHLRGAIFRRTKIRKIIFDYSTFWDQEEWLTRYWTEEDWREISEMALPQMSDFDPDGILGSIDLGKTDFRGSNVTVEQVKLASKWNTAIYDDAFLQQVESSNYQIPESGAET